MSESIYAKNENDIAMELSDNIDKKTIEYPKVINPDVKSIECVFQTENIFLVFTGEKFGLINEDGIELAPFIYDFAYPFNENLACVMKNGKYGFIDKDGKETIPFVFDKANSFSEGLAYFETGDTYGFINKMGKEVFRLDCDSISSFKEGRAFISIDGKYGFIDKSGKVIIDCIYDDVSYFDKGVAVVRKGVYYGVIDSMGNEAIPIEYDFIKVGEKFIEATKDSKSYNFDFSGKSLSNNNLTPIEIHDNYFIFQSDNKYGVSDFQGNIKINAIYDSIIFIENKNLFIVSQSEKFGIVDSNGKIMVPLQYDQISTPYSENKYLDYVNIHTNDKRGVLNLLNFTETIPAIYDIIYTFQEGYAIVYDDDEYGIIDKKGQIIIPFTEYDYIFSISDNLLCLRKDNSYYLAKNNGKKISSVFYDNINSVSRVGDYRIFEKDGKEGLLDRNGNEVLEATYDYISSDSYNNVYGSYTSYIATTYDEINRYSIIIVDKYQEIDMSDIVLVNEITPRIKPFHTITMLNTPFSEIQNYSIKTMKLFRVDDYEKPILYFYQKPVESMNFPMSDSVFYCIENNEAKEIVRGYECGGSMRGNYVQLYYEKETSKIILGTEGFWGGFGGHASDNSFYKNNEEFLFLCQISQTSKNYDKDYLIENANMLYDNEGTLFNKENILEAESIEEYSINNKIVLKEKYIEESKKYISISMNLMGF